MQLIFKSIKWKNLLSTGENWTEIQLSGTGRTVIYGKNGAGKSTLLDAICFVLFSKPYRNITKPQLVNSVNGKHTLVSICFDKGSTSYRVERGLYPGKFEIYADGKLLAIPGNAAAQQAYFEKNILGLSYKSFTQIVILGTTSYVPFMKLPAAARREVIENLLDIQIFTMMNNLLRDRVAANKTEYDLLEDRMHQIKRTSGIIKEHIASMEQNSQELIAANDKEIEEALATVRTLTEQNEKALERIETYKPAEKTLPETEKNISDATYIRSQLQAKIKRQKQTIDFFEENTSCPTCSQEIDSDFRDNIVLKKQTVIDKTEKSVEELDAEMRLMKERLKQLHSAVEEMDNIKLLVETNNTNIRYANETIEKAQKRNEMVRDQSADIEAEREKLAKERERLAESLERAQKLLDERNVFEAAKPLLKDQGFKTQIIKQYIPVINQMVNKYLQAMEFFANFTLNDKLEEVIKSRYRDAFSYDSFSEGEKDRIDLALILTWRAIAKMKNSVNTNLLIMDEVFDGSLDKEGSEQFRHLLKSLGDDTDVFVISHNQDLIEKFERTLHFVKHKNFSRLEA